MIRGQSLVRRYHRGGVVLNALDGIDIKIQPNTRVAITGPSGSGKSTLLQVLGLIDSDFEGSLTVTNQNVRRLSNRQRAQIRLSRFGFVFQEFHLLQALTAEQNVALPHWRLHGNRKRAKDRARHLLSALGLAERLSHHPHRLSGGERQRVAIARALANQPAIIFADEPTASLDQNSGGQVLQVLLEQQNTAIVVVTHDPALAKHTDHIISLRAGRIISPPLPTKGRDELSQNPGREIG